MNEASKNRRRENILISTRFSPIEAYKLTYFFLIGKNALETIRGVRSHSSIFYQTNKADLPENKDSIKQCFKPSLLLATRLDRQILEILVEALYLPLHKKFQRVSLKNLLSEVQAD